MPEPGISILIAEDEEGVREKLKAAAKRVFPDADIRTANAPSPGVRMLKERKADLLITDIYFEGACQDAVNELMEEALRRNRRVQIVVNTGAPSDVIRDTYNAYRGNIEIADPGSGRLLESILIDRKEMLRARRMPESADMMIVKAANRALWMAHDKPGTLRNPWFMAELGLRKHLAGLCTDGGRKREIEVVFDYVLAMRKVGRAKV